MTSVVKEIQRKYATAAAWRPLLAHRSDWLRACFLHFCGRKSRLFGWLQVPLTPQGDTRPIHCRPGTSDFVTFQEIFFNQEYRLANKIPSADVRGVLDLGANVGLAARWLLIKFPEARVFGVEPDAANLALARKNLIADSSWHRVIHGFAGGESRTAFLRSSGRFDANQGMLQDEPIAGKNAIPVLSGAELCRLAACQLDIAKIDIEGTEKELLEADVGWLRPFRWIFLEVHDPLDEQWLATIVANRLPGWEIIDVERRHARAFLAFLHNRHPVAG
jgi:FkbM family methyltransferase